jgi:hypothetical protein
LWNRVAMKGKSFGKWTVLEEAGRNKHGKIMWTCKCECGTVKDICGENLRSGNSSSCGCYKLQTSSERSTKHGMSRTRFYNIWSLMIRRCTDPNFSRYEVYGGRGVKVTQHWRDFINFRDDLLESYENHVKMFGEKETTLDRIDVNGDYEPKNVRFATQNEQAQNRRILRSNKSGVTGVCWNKQKRKWVAKITFNGKETYLGAYENIDEAIDARKRAEVELGYGAVRFWGGE